MKKCIAFFAVLATFLVSVPASSQVRFGVKGGLNINRVDLNNISNNIRMDNRTGFFAGITLDVDLPVVGLGTDISVIYDNKVAAVFIPSIGGTSTDLDSKKTLEYVEVPVNVKYTIGLGTIASIYASTGPQVAWNIGNRKWINAANITEGWELEKSELSWNVGGGFTVNHIRLGYNYNVALGKTAEFQFKKAVNETVTGKLKNNTHQIFVTYFF